jgi:hypothetical protein
VNTLLVNIELCDQQESYPMQPTKKIKLNIARQTVRALDNDNLGRVVGGVSAGTGENGPCTIGSHRECTRTSVPADTRCGGW